jgi:hypothetical protein
MNYSVVKITAKYWRLLVQPQGEAKVALTKYLSKIYTTVPTL